VLVLAFLVGSSWTPDGLARGVVALARPTPVVMASAFGALLLAAAARMVGPGGARSWWARAGYLVIAAYAVAAFVLAVRDQTPVTAALRGGGFWQRLPWWAQGTWVGAFLLLPLAFFRELGASIARLATTPYLRWMIVFGLGCWIALNLSSL